MSSPQSQPNYKTDIKTGQVTTVVHLPYKICTLLTTLLAWSHNPQPSWQVHKMDWVMTYSPPSTSSKLMSPNPHIRLHLWPPQLHLCLRTCLTRTPNEATSSSPHWRPLNYVSPSTTGPQTPPSSAFNLPWNLIGTWQTTLVLGMGHYNSWRSWSLPKLLLKWRSGHCFLWQSSPKSDWWALHTWQSSRCVPHSLTSSHRTPSST